MSLIRHILITRENYRKFDLCNLQLAFASVLSCVETIDYFLGCRFYSLNLKSIKFLVCDQSQVGSRCWAPWGRQSPGPAFSLTSNFRFLCGIGGGGRGGVIELLKDNPGPVTQPGGGAMWLTRELHDIIHWQSVTSSRGTGELWQENAVIDIW